MVLWLVIGLTTNSKASKGRSRPKARPGVTQAHRKSARAQGDALRKLRSRMLALEGKLAVLASALDFEFEPDAREGKPLILEEE